MNNMLLKITYEYIYIIKIIPCIIFYLAFITSTLYIISVPLIILLNHDFKNGCVCI